MKHEWWTKCVRERGGELTKSEEEDIEGWAWAGWTRGASEPPWLPEDNQGCPPIGAIGACIWDIGGNWGNALALFCVWPKEDGANWNNAKLQK